MAGGMLLILVAAWLFVRIWWGHLPHTIANAVT